MKKKEGSITDMERILWKPNGKDKANLAVVERWYMDRYNIKDCSEVYGAAILREGINELADLIRKRKV